MSRLWLVLAVLLAIPGATASGADFVAGSSSRSDAFTAAADVNTVAAALDDPGGRRHVDRGLRGRRGAVRLRLGHGPSGRRLARQVAQRAPCRREPRGLPKGRVKVRIEVRAANGRTYRSGRTYRTCAGR